MATNHQGYVLSLVGDDDPIADAIAAPIGTLYQRTDTGALYTKIGAGNDDWMPFAGAQVFSYTCDGTETDTFAIALPTARANATYQVQMTMAGPSANAMKNFRPIASSRTINGFNVELSAAAENGDVLWFTVSDPT